MFAPLARLESIRLLLGLACVLWFKIYQMDIKSDFLNRIIKEEFYIKESKGFEDPNFPYHVMRLHIAIYRLK